MQPDQDASSHNRPEPSLDDWLEFAATNGLCRADVIPPELRRDLSARLPILTGLNLPEKEMKSFLKVLEESPEGSVAALHALESCARPDDPQSMRNTASASVLLSLVSEEHRAFVVDSLYAHAHEGNLEGFWRTVLWYSLAFQRGDQGAVLREGVVVAAIRKALHVPDVAESSINQALRAAECASQLYTAGVRVEIPEHGLSFCHIFAAVLGKVAGEDEHQLGVIVDGVKRSLERSHQLWRNSYKAYLVSNLYSELAKQGCEIRHRVFRSILGVLTASTVTGASMCGHILREICEQQPSDCEDEVFDMLKEAVDRPKGDLLENAVIALASFSTGLRESSRKAAAYFVLEAGQAPLKRAETMLYGLQLMLQSEISVVPSRHRIELLSRLLSMAGELSVSDTGEPSGRLQREERRKLVMRAVEEIIPDVPEKSIPALVRTCLCNSGSLHLNDQETLLGLLYSVAHNCTEGVLRGIEERLNASDCREDEICFIVEFVSALVTLSEKSNIPTFLTWEMRSSLIEWLEQKREDVSELVKVSIDGALDRLYFRSAFPEEEEA